MKVLVACGAIAIASALSACSGMEVIDIDSLPPEKLIWPTAFAIHEIELPLESEEVSADLPISYLRPKIQKYNNAPKVMILPRAHGAGLCWHG